MKILFIITRADTVGGAQIHVLELALALRLKGHQVLVLTGVSGLYTDELRVKGVEFLACDFFEKQIRPIKDCLTLNFLQKVIAEFQPDIITTHSSKSGILGRVAAKISNVPCIFTAHGWAFADGVPKVKRTVYQFLEKWAEPLAQRIICVSEADRKLALKAGMQSERLITVYNGMPSIDEKMMAAPHKSNPVRIVMVARFDRQKDHLTLLKAIHNIPDVQLDLVGDGPEFELVKALASKLSIADKVNFLGFRTDVAKILSQAQIFALISNWEGFPLTTIEAMRAGLPVVVSDVGGASEAIVEGVTGYGIPQGDINLLHKRLKELVNNTQLRVQMGAEGRKRYEEKFTFSTMFEQTFEIYSQILN